MRPPLTSLMHSRGGFSFLLPRRSFSATCVLATFDRPTSFYKSRHVTPSRGPAVAERAPSQLSLHATQRAMFLEILWPDEPPPIEDAETVFRECANALEPSAIPSLMRIYKRQFHSEPSNSHSSEEKQRKIITWILPALCEIFLKASRSSSSSTTPFLPDLALAFIRVLYADAHSLCQHHPLPPYTQKLLMDVANRTGDGQVVRDTFAAIIDSRRGKYGSGGFTLVYAVMISFVGKEEGVAAAEVIYRQWCDVRTRKETYSAHGQSVRRSWAVVLARSERWREAVAMCEKPYHSRPGARPSEADIDDLIVAIRALCYHKKPLEALRIAEAYPQPAKDAQLVRLYRLLILEGIDATTPKGSEALKAWLAGVLQSASMRGARIEEAWWMEQMMKGKVGSSLGMEKVFSFYDQAFNESK